MTADGIDRINNNADGMINSAGGSERTWATVDDSISGTRESEQATVKRLATRREYEGRTFKKSDHEGADFVDDLNRSSDALGDGTKSKYFNEDEFKRSIDHHLRKSNDFTVIDMTGYTSDQISGITSYVDDLPASIQDRIIRVGF